ncbi:MAG: hypothetical protein J7L25_02935 [Deltaproteobacteria bacterium]|nr:hypothetical protein [Candidatus Tharpella aukensis]
MQCSLEPLFLWGGSAFFIQMRIEVALKSEKGSLIIETVFFLNIADIFGQGVGVDDIGRVLVPDRPDTSETASRKITRCSRSRKSSPALRTAALPSVVISRSFNSYRSS